MKRFILFILTICSSSVSMAAYNTTNTNPDSYGHAQCYSNGGVYQVQFIPASVWGNNNTVTVSANAKAGDIIAKGVSYVWGGTGNPYEMSTRAYNRNDIYYYCKTAGSLSFNLSNDRGYTAAPGNLGSQGWYKSPANSKFYFRFTLGKKYNQGGVLPTSNSSQWPTSSYDISLVPQNTADPNAPKDRFGNAIYGDSSYEAYKLTYGTLIDSKLAIYWEVMLAVDATSLNQTENAAGGTYMTISNIVSGWGTSVSQPYVQRMTDVGFWNFWVKKEACDVTPIPTVSFGTIKGSSITDGTATPVQISVNFTCALSSNVYWGISLVDNPQGEYISDKLPDLKGYGRVPLDSTSKASGFAIQLLKTDNSLLKLIDFSDLSSGTQPNMSTSSWNSIGSVSSGTSRTVIFKAVPVKLQGETLKPGDFTARAYFLLEYN